MSKDMKDLSLVVLGFCAPASIIMAVVAIVSGACIFATISNVCFLFIIFIVLHTIHLLILEALQRQRIRLIEKHFGFKFPKKTLDRFHVV